MSGSRWRRRRAPCLIAVSDDATKRVLHAALYPSESHAGGDDESRGRPPHARACRWRCTPTARTGRFTRPKAKGPVDKTRLTQVGRALARLGIEHIPSYSPQARGRSERLNRTFQDRLVNELRVAGITTLTAANRVSRRSLRPAAQRDVRARAARSGECVRAARRRRSRRHSVP